MFEIPNLIIIILILLNVVFFCLGYIIGKIQNSQVVFNSQSNRINRPTAMSKITIDETKVVTDINLSGLEKKYDQLGETKTNNEKISSSINKLKALKS